jgi:parallel beta-helix repeat protein
MAIVVAALATWLLMAGSASAAVVLVDPADTTADGGGCGSVVNPCNTLQAGVDNAVAGDTIVLAPGTYTGNANVNKTVTIQGPNSGVDPRTTSCDPVLPEAVFVNGTTISANGVIIDGITVDGVPAFPGDVIGAGLYYVPSASGYELRNSVIKNNSIGIYLNSNGVSLSTVEHNCIIDNTLAGPAGNTGLYSDQGVGNVLIFQNYSENNPNAAYLFDTFAATPTNITIDDNDMVSDGDIALFQTTNSTISNNTSTNGIFMMVFLGGDNSMIEIENNTGVNEPGGVTMVDVGYGPNSDIDIHDNNFDGDDAAGTFGVEAAAGGITTGLTVNTNVLTDDEAGVKVDGATSPVITANTISGFETAGTGSDAGIRVLNTSGFTVNTNDINGGHVGSCVGGLWGIYTSDSSGTINSNIVTGIGNGLTTGCQEGRGIEAAGAGVTVTMASNNVSAYQKSGIIVRDTVDSVLNGNTVTGEGATAAIAQNGITITSGGTASITLNGISNNWYTPDSDQSCGILYFPTVAPASGALSVTNNTSTGDENGICVLNGTTSSDGAIVQLNTVNAFKERGIYLDGVTNVDVSNNIVDGQGNGTSSSAGTDPDTDVRYYGIFVVDSTGDVRDNTIHGITHGPADGSQSGVGIRVSARSGASSDMDIVRNNVFDYQKNGIVVMNPYGGTSVNADVDDNTVTGSGPINYIAQNGIQISNGATATVTNNEASQHDYTPGTFSAIGILFIGAGAVSGSGNNVHDNMEGVFVQSSALSTFNSNIITRSRDVGIFVFDSHNGTYDSNTITFNDIGWYNADGNGNTLSNSDVSVNGTGIVIDGASDDVDVLSNLILNNTPGDGMTVQPFISNPTNIEAHLNCISGNLAFGMSADPTIQIIDAENNWWGAPDGPGPVGPGSGDNVTTNIDFTPFLTAPTSAHCPSNPTPTPEPTDTPAPTDTPEPTPTPTPLITDSPTPVVTDSPTPVVTNSPTPVVTNSPTPVVTASPSPTVLPGTQTPAPSPGAVGGVVDVFTTGGTGSSSGGLSLLALLAMMVAITAVSGSGLYAFVRRRY